MQWREVDKNAHLRRDSDYVSVLAKNTCRLFGCGNFETTEGVRTDSPAGDVDSHTIVCNSCAQAHVSIHACDFTEGYLQWQEIVRILLYRMPAEGTPEEGVAGRAMLASRDPIYGARDAGRALWLRLKNTCKHFKCSLIQTQILPTLFTLRNEESKIIVVMSSNVDDLLCGHLLEGAEATNSVLQQFLGGKEEQSTLRSCWKEFRQDEDFGFHVREKDNTEVHQLRSVTQSLAWIARQTRLDFS